MFDRLAAFVSRLAGQPATFLVSVLIVLGWAATGPVFHYSDTWQLVINTGTTIVTFLMCFLIQATQNRDAAALHLKLDALISVNRDLSNRLISIEHRPVQEIVEEAERMRVELRED
jgi:low affinity Fe/Cu permease